MVTTAIAPSRTELSDYGNGAFELEQAQPALQIAPQPTQTATRLAIIALE